MDHSKLIRAWANVLAVSVLLIGCQIPDAKPDEQPRQSSVPNGTIGITSLPKQTSSPTPDCIGWSCEINGIVYSGAVEPGNELAGVAVAFYQISWCSPTAGKQETQTNSNGSFSFEVFVHDTDTYRIQIDVDGYQTAEIMMGGFDCLFCSCPLVEIVLKAK